MLLRWLAGLGREISHTLTGSETPLQWKRSSSGEQAQGDRPAESSDQPSETTGKTAVARRQQLARRATTPTPLFLRETVPLGWMLFSCDSC